jgi:protein TonB
MKHVSENAELPPADRQFTHFWVLDAGSQSRSSFVSSAAANLILVIAICLASATAVRSTLEARKQENLTYVAIKPLARPKPTLSTPKQIVAKKEQPKIVVPETPRPPSEVVKPMPAPPKALVAVAAPKPVLVEARRASDVNHDPHPPPVSLGVANNPIAPSNRPAVAAVDLGQRGLPSMRASNSGEGPSATRVNLGSGQPNGSLSGTGSRTIAGVRLGVPGGVPGGTGNGNGGHVAQVSLGQTASPSSPSSLNLRPTKTSQAPQVVYKPRPVYTQEATALKIEGVVSVRIHIGPSSAVTVLGITRGLGHGLDESAVRAVQGTRFRPAVDENGAPIDWEGIVNISFQMAS